MGETSVRDATSTHFITDPNIAGWYAPLLVQKVTDTNTM